MEETLTASPPPKRKEFVSVAVRPLVKGVVYAVARPKTARTLDEAETQKIAKQVSMLLADVLGVSGGTTTRLSDYEVMGYFVDTQELVSALPVIWRQFKAATRRIKDLSDCTLSLSTHIGTVYVEELALGEQRKFETSGETVEFVKALGQYVPEDRIWVTNSAIVAAQKVGVVSAYHRVPGAVPGAPNEGVFEWRSPEAAAPPASASGAQTRSRRASPAEVLGRLAKVVAYVVVIGLAIFGAGSLIMSSLNSTKGVAASPATGKKKTPPPKPGAGKAKVTPNADMGSRRTTGRNSNRSTAPVWRGQASGAKKVSAVKTKSSVTPAQAKPAEPKVEPFPTSVPPLEPAPKTVPKPAPAADTSPPSSTDSPAAGTTTGG